MPRMTYAIIRDRIKDIVNLTASKEKLIADSVQWALDDISNAHAWPHLMIPNAFITTVAPHSTGNVNVTNGSKTVSGGVTSPVFTADMVGRKFRAADQNAYYIIAAFVSATEITLEQSFQGDTEIDQNYSIFKDEYRLPADLDQIKVMRQIENGIAMSALGASVFDVLEPTPQAKGTPRFNLIAGSKRDIYNTGTVSAGNNSSTITGAATPAWTSVDGLGRGTRLTIGTQVFTVKTVDSDTQITTYEKTTSSISAGASYELLMDNFIIQIFPLPDSAKNIYFRYQRIADLLVNDQDIPDMPDQFQHLLVDGGVSVVWQTKDKTEADAKYIKFLSRIQEMKKRLGNITPNKIYKRHSLVDSLLIDRLGDPRAPGNFGSFFRP